MFDFTPGMTFLLFIWILCFIYDMVKKDVSMFFAFCLTVLYGLFRLVIPY